MKVNFYSSFPVLNIKISNALRYYCETGCDPMLGQTMIYRRNVTFHWCCSEFHHGTWAWGTAARGEDPPGDYPAAPSLGIHQGTRNTLQLYHRQGNLAAGALGRGLMPVERSSRAVSYPRPGLAAHLSSQFRPARRHHTATCPGLVAAILLLPTHKTLALDRALCPPRLGIQPGIVKMEKKPLQGTQNDPTAQLIVYPGGTKWKQL